MLATIQSTDAEEGGQERDREGGTLEARGVADGSM